MGSFENRDVKSYRRPVLLSCFSHFKSVPIVYVYKVLLQFSNFTFEGVDRYLVRLLSRLMKPCRPPAFVLLSEKYGYFRCVSTV